MGLFESNQVIQLFYDVSFIVIISVSFVSSLVILANLNLYTIAWIDMAAYFSWLIMYLLRMVYKLKTNDYVNKVITDELPK